MNIEERIFFHKGILLTGCKVMKQDGSTIKTV